MRNYYAILGIPRTATEKQIKDAYHFSVKAFHPDKFAASSITEKTQAEERTKAVNEAYHTLVDSIRRAEYDRRWDDNAANTTSRTSQEARNTESSDASRPHPWKPTPAAPPQPPPKPPGATPRRPPPPRPSSSAPPPPPTPSAPPSHRKFTQVAAVIVLILGLLCIALWGISTTDRNVHRAEEAPIASPTATVAETAITQAPSNPPRVMRATLNTPEPSLNLPPTTEPSTPLPVPTIPGKTTTLPVVRPRIVFAPRPTIRYSAKFSGEHRAGKFRITFARTGQATRVEVVQTTGNAVLDRAAINALARWKCEPGQSGEIVVPIDYQ